MTGQGALPEPQHDGGRTSSGDGNDDGGQHAPRHGWKATAPKWTVSLLFPERFKGSHRLGERLVASLQPLIKIGSQQLLKLCIGWPVDDL